MGSGRRAARERSVMARLEHFCDVEGLAMASLGHEVTAAFVEKGLSSRTPSTRGTYRSVLRQVVGPPRVRAGAPFSASPAPAPYRPDERSELWAMAMAQPKAWRRHSALVLMALGIGAGLRAGEITLATTADVVGRTGSLRVSVGVEVPRTVRVQPDYAAPLAALAKRTDGTFLFHRPAVDRNYYNFVNDFCRQLVCDPGAPKLSANRCRSSFICDHLAAGTPLSVLLEMSGIKEVESLLRYAVHVEGAPHSKAALRHQLAIERP
jgi:integrase